MERQQTSKGFLYVTFISLTLIYSSVVYNCIVSSTSVIFKAVAVYLISCNLFAFYRCSMIDPGFINENKYPTFELKPLHFKNTVDIIPDAFNNTRMLYFSEADGSTTNYVQKYCNTCNIFRPLMAAHCNDCGRCVLEKDHHCLWIDNCIGRNNIQVFFCFITTLLVLDLYNAISFSKLVRSRPLVHYLFVKTVFMGLSVVFGMLLLSFVCYNTFLAIFSTPSRTFIKNPLALKCDVDCKKIVKRLCTIKPAIFSIRTTV